MLTDATRGVLNHLLADEDWARQRLAPFTGQTVRLTFGALNLPLQITAEGLFEAADPNAVAQVSLTLPPDAPLRTLTDGASLLSSAQISGSAELAECLGFVFRNLSWDAENDLSRLFGDIAARRLVAGGKQLFKWHQQQARNLALNLAEYFTEEHPSIARRFDVAAFCAAVEKLHTPLTSLEKRIAALENISV